MKCLKCKAETTNPKYCSRSCAASTNNRGVVRNGSAPVMHKCLLCPSWTTNPKVCSRKCGYKLQMSKTEKLFRAGKIIHSKQIRIQMMLRHGNRCMNPKCTWDHKGFPVVCQVDHKDGDPYNNKPSNLRLLCPNCHSRTRTFGSKNRGNGRWERRQRYAEGKSS